MTNHLPEAVADAVWAHWQYNGHDLLDALTRVYRGHPAPSVRKLAGEAHAMAMRMPMVWDAYQKAMQERAAAERDATG